MKTEKEIREIKDKLEKLTGFIADHSTPEDYGKSDMAYSNNVCDALSWVLEEIKSTEQFVNDYIDISKLEALARKVEGYSGRKLEEYE